MRHAWVLAMVGVGTGCAAPSRLAEPRSYPFADDAVGGPAAGFIVAATPAGAGAGRRAGPGSYPCADAAAGAPAAGFIVPATPAGPAAGLWQVAEDASAPSPA